MPEPIDELPPIEPLEDLPPLWKLAPHPQRSTVTLAANDAAVVTEKRYEQILKLIRDRGPMTLGEVAAALHLADNRISGRFTELRQKGVIEITGERRRNPRSRSMAEVYRITLTQGESR